MAKIKKGLYPQDFSGCVSTFNILILLSVSGRYIDWRICFVEFRHDMSRGLILWPEDWL